MNVTYNCYGIFNSYYIGFITYINSKIQNKFNARFIICIIMDLDNFPSLLKNYFRRLQFKVVSVKSYFSVKDCCQGIGADLTTLLFSGSFSYAILFSVFWYNNFYLQNLYYNFFFFHLLFQWTLSYIKETN
jgi:hypothetical protein